MAKCKICGNRINLKKSHVYSWVNHRKVYCCIEHDGEFSQWLDSLPTDDEGNIIDKQLKRPLTGQSP
jgi:hypothetical protein